MRWAARATKRGRASRAVGRPVRSLLGRTYIVVTRADLVEESASLRAVQPNLADDLRKRVVPRANLLAHRAARFVEAALEECLKLDDISPRRGLRHVWANDATDAALDGLGSGQHSIRLGCGQVPVVALAVATRLRAWPQGRLRR